MGAGSNLPNLGMQLVLLLTYPGPVIDDAIWGNIYVKFAIVIPHPGFEQH